MKNSFCIVFFCALVFIIGGCKSKKDGLSIKKSNTKTAIPQKPKELKSTFIDAQKEIAIGNNEAAKKMLTSVLKQDPTCDACQYQLSKIALTDLQFDEAYKQGEAAFTAQPDNAFYRQHFAEMTFRKGDPSKAGSISKPLIDSFPTIREHYRRTLYYFESAKNYKEAKDVISQYQYRFGFVYETGQMYEQLYKLQGKQVDLLANKKALVHKYPKDIALKQDYTHALIEQNHLAAADSQLNELIQLENNAGFAYLQKTKINIINNDWVAFVKNYNLACDDPQLEAKIKTQYLIKSENIKDSSILKSIRKLTIDEPDAIEYYNYYANKFGLQLNDDQTLALAFAKNPDDFEIGIALTQSYLKEQKFNEALNTAIMVYENHPSRYESYLLYSKALLRVGQFADAYAIAENGISYALNKDEIASLVVVQAFANFYLDKKANLKIDLEKAWGYIDTANAVKGELYYLCIFSGRYEENVASTLKNLGNHNVVEFYKTFASPYNESKLHSQSEKSILNLEGAMLKAIKDNEKAAALGYLKQLINLAPSNQFYQQKLKELNKQ